MNYLELVKELKKTGVKVKKYGAVKEQGRTYPLYCVAENFGFDKTVLITSGFHGEEFNGPISLVKILPLAASYARRKKVNLLVYPCVNPSGFDKRERYNLSNEKLNNHFLVYKNSHGKRILILKRREKFAKFELEQSPAKEVRCLQTDLKKRGLLRFPPAVVLDIHQDDELGKLGDFYVYIFNQHNLYKKIMKETEKYGRVARRIKSRNLHKIGDVMDSIDKDGFLIQHDGTLTDMFYRLGTPFSVTIETNNRAPLSRVKQINLLWIKRMIDLVGS